MAAVVLFNNDCGSGCCGPAVSGCSKVGQVTLACNSTPARMVVTEPAMVVVIMMYWVCGGYGDDEDGYDDRGHGNCDDCSPHSSCNCGSLVSPHNHTSVTVWVVEVVHITTTVMVVGLASTSSPPLAFSPVLVGPGVVRDVPGARHLTATGPPLVIVPPAPASV